jgi:hypothetical protein
MGLGTNGSFDHMKQGAAPPIKPRCPFIPNA